MEESAEKRRERLKALRDEASFLADKSDVAGSPVATPQDAPGLHVQQSPHPSASPHFDFYTDPLAAFNASSQKKKKKLNSTSPAPVFPQSPPSPLWRENVYNNHTSNFFHTASPSPPGLQQNGRANPNATPPGKFISPGPASYIGNMAPSSSYHTPYCNPYPSRYSAGRVAYGSQMGFGSRQPSPHSHHFNGGGSGGYSTNSPRLQQNSGGDSFLMTNPPTQWNGTGDGVLSSGLNQGGNSLRGSLNRSPRGAHKSNTPGRSGGRGSQRSHNHFEVSAVTNPELFFSRSMLVDPWKDLVPIGTDSVESRMDSCSDAGPSSQDWLPKSVCEKTPPPNTKSFIVSASGPSLAESLADSLADAVDGST